MILKKLDATSIEVDSLILHSFAINANNMDVAKRLMDIHHIPLRPDLLLHKASSAQNIVFNVLADSGVIWSGIDRRDIRKSLAGYHARTRLDTAGILTLLSTISADAPKPVADATNALSIAALRNLVDIYSQTVAVDFNCHIVPRQRPGVTQSTFYQLTDEITIVLATLTPSADFAWDDPHAGSHLFFLVSGSLTLHLGDHLIKMDENGRRLVVFDASTIRHACNATASPTTLLVLTFLPPARESGTKRAWIFEPDQYNHQDVVAREKSTGSPATHEETIAANTRAL
jgi:hypothetical protein